MLLHNYDIVLHHITSHYVIHLIYAIPKIYNNQPLLQYHMYPLSIPCNIMYPSFIPRNTVNIFLTSQYPSFSNSVSVSQQYAFLISSSLSYSSSSISFVNSIGITCVPYLPLIFISSFSISIFLTFSLIQSFPKINNLSAFSITSTSVVSG